MPLAKLQCDCLNAVGQIYKPIPFQRYGIRPQMYMYINMYGDAYLYDLISGDFSLG